MRRRMFTRLALSLSLLLIVVSTARADVALPAVLGDHMVLQRDIALPLWGTAEAGEEVAVTLAGQTVKATADAEGCWQVLLPPQKAGGPVEITVAGKNSRVLRDVLFGEVWVCSGQSNMQWAVRQAVNPAEEIAQADYPSIRLFSVKRAVAHAPLTDTQGRWAACSSDTVGSFSAVGYFFGRSVHKALGVPVGLIHTSWGGTPAEAWTTQATLEAYPEFDPILKRWAAIAAGIPKAQKAYEVQIAEWEKAVAAARAAGKQPPRRPRPPMDRNHPHWPAGLNNGMIAPIVPFAIKGAIWYQGESNAGRAYQYRSLFSAMIRDWRQQWGQGDFPFFFVQLANFRAVAPEPGESDWAELREAQTMALALPRTGMAVTIDIGAANDIHPKNKQEVGRRLSLAAQAVAYGRDLTYSGPLYNYMSVVGEKIRLYFTHTDGGLVTRGQELKGFAIAGRDRQFVRAKARIEGDTIVVWNEKVPHPVAVRYAWAINPVCNLYNKANLPASPFRTDSWPGVTAKRE